jgi:hypothetical protein
MPERLIGLQESISQLQSFPRVHVGEGSSKRALHIPVGSIMAMAVANVGSLNQPGSIISASSRLSCRIFEDGRALGCTPYHNERREDFRD